MFKEIIVDLETLEIKYDEKYLTLILSCSLPASFTSFRGTILYSRDTLTIEDAYDVLFSKEKMNHLIGFEVRDGEVLLFMVIGEEVSRCQISVIKFVIIVRRNDTLRGIATNCRTNVI